MHLFIAADLDEGEQPLGQDESTETVRIPVVELPTRLGDLADAKTLAAVVLYLRQRGL